MNTEHHKYLLPFPCFGLNPASVIIPRREIDGEWNKSEGMKVTKDQAVTASPRFIQLVTSLAFLFSINYTKDQSKDIYGSTGSKGLYFWIWDLKITGEALKIPYYWVFIFHILKGTILIYFHSEPLELWIRGVFFEPWVRSRLLEVSPQSDIIRWRYYRYTCVCVQILWFLSSTGMNEYISL